MFHSVENYPVLITICMFVCVLICYYWKKILSFNFVKMDSLLGLWFECFNSKCFQVKYPAVSILQQLWCLCLKLAVHFCQASEYCSTKHMYSIRKKSLWSAASFLLCAVDRLEDALQSALTYLLFHDGEEFMTENVVFYREVLGQDGEPREVSPYSTLTVQSLVWCISRC